jgi:hypothetical protein
VIDPPAAFCAASEPGIAAVNSSTALTISVAQPRLEKNCMIPPIGLPVCGNLRKI